MFLHPIGVSLAKSFNLVSNIWHVEVVMQSVINVSRYIDNYSEVFVLKFF